MTFEIIATCVMLAMLAVSVLTDVRTRTIPNMVTAPCALLGVALGAMAGGLAGAIDHVLGLVIVLIILSLLSPLAVLGGGDIKLLMAVGALHGCHFALWTLLLTGVAGGSLALITVARRKALKHTTANLLSHVVAKTTGVSTDLAAGSVVGKMHYSLAIAIGVLAALVLRA